MADDFTWILTGTTKWSRVYRGKQAVRRELLAPLFAQFNERYTNTAHRILAGRRVRRRRMPGTNGDEGGEALQQPILLRHSPARRKDEGADGVPRYRARRGGAVAAEPTSVPAAGPPNGRSVEEGGEVIAAVAS